MDPLSGIASAIAIIQIAEEICTILKDYTVGVAEAKGDIQRLRDEVLALQSIFMEVKNLQNQPEPGKLAILDLLAKPGGLMQRCLENLRDLAAKLKPGDGTTTMKRVGVRALKWPFIKKDIEEKMAILERYKSTFIVAFSASNTTTLAGIVLKLIDIGKGVEQIDKGVAKLKDDFLVLQTEAAATEASKKRDLVIAWLATTDSFGYHELACKKRQPDTGRWFVDGPYMDLWKKQDSMLWLYGIPGCGKTVLSSTIIQSMEDHCSSDPTTIIAYYYFSFNDSAKQTARNMASSLVAQICNSLTDMPKEIVALYEKNTVWKRSAAMSDLKATLKLLISRTEGGTIASTKDIFIVIDALDECSKRDEQREALDLIREMRSWSSTNLHLLVTSRKEPDIEEKIIKFVTEPPISIEGSQVASDIDLFINGRIRAVDKLNKLPQDLKAEIKDTLTNGANGMFRWVFCQLEALERCPPLQTSIEKVLRNLPLDLNKTYERLLMSIEGEDCRRMARNCLLWLAFSKRPLSLEEVAEIAVLSEDFDEDFNKLQRFQNDHYIFELLGSLIVYTPGTEVVEDSYGFISRTIKRQNSVTLAHFSIVDYLVSGEIGKSQAAYFALDEINAHTIICHTCFRYIFGFDKSASIPEKIICFNNSTIWDINRKFYWAKHGFPLLDYTCMLWDTHVKLVPFESQERVQPVVMRLLSSSSAFFCWIQIRRPEYIGGNISICPSESDMHKYCQRPTQPLINAAALGLRYCVGQLMDVNGPSEQWHRGLRLAIYMRRIRVAQLFLDSGLDVSGLAGQDALRAAIINRDYPMVKRLVEAGVDVHTVPDRQLSLLHLAIYKSNENVIDLLLDKKVDTGKRSYDGKTVLHIAASRLTTSFVKRFLTEFHLDVNALDENNYTALHIAVEYGKTNIARLLLDFGIDINKQNKDGETALHCAAKGGKFLITELLLEANADHTIRQKDGRTALDVAGGPEAETTVRLLQVAMDCSNNASERRVI